MILVCEVGQKALPGSHRHAQSHVSGPEPQLVQLSQRNIIFWGVGGWGQKGRRGEKFKAFILYGLEGKTNGVLQTLPVCTSFEYDHK